jgi:hypothetical protein
MIWVNFRYPGASPTPGGAGNPPLASPPEAVPAPAPKGFFGEARLGGKIIRFVAPRLGASLAGGAGLMARPMSRVGPGMPWPRSVSPEADPGALVLPGTGRRFGMFLSLRSKVATSESYRQLSLVSYSNNLGLRWLVLLRIYLFCFCLKSIFPTIPRSLSALACSPLSSTTLFFRRDDDI